jgi:hypothetical protein
MSVETWSDQERDVTANKAFIARDAMASTIVRSTLRSDKRVRSRPAAAPGGEPRGDWRRDGPRIDESAHGAAMRA